MGALTFPQGFEPYSIHDGGAVNGDGEIRTRVSVMLTQGTVNAIDRLGVPC